MERLERGPQRCLHHPPPGHTSQKKHIRPQGPPRVSNFQPLWADTGLGWHHQDLTKQRLLQIEEKGERGRWEVGGQRVWRKKKPKPELKVCSQRNPQQADRHPLVTRLAGDGVREIWDHWPGLLHLHTSQLSL